MPPVFSGYFDILNKLNKIGKEYKVEWTYPNHLDIWWFYQWINGASSCDLCSCFACDFSTSSPSSSCASPSSPFLCPYPCPCCPSFFSHGLCPSSCSSFWSCRRFLNGLLSLSSFSFLRFRWSFRNQRNHQNHLMISYAISSRSCLFYFGLIPSLAVSGLTFLSTFPSLFISISLFIFLGLFLCPWSFLSHHLFHVSSHLCYDHGLYLYLYLFPDLC